MAAAAAPSAVVHHTCLAANLLLSLALLQWSRVQLSVSVDGLQSVQGQRLGLMVLGSLRARDRVSVLTVSRVLRDGIREY